MLKAAEELGLGLEDVASAATGDAAALRDLRRTVDGYSDAATDASRASQESGRGLDEEAAAAFDMAGEAENLLDKVTSLAGETDEGVAAARRNAKAMGEEEQAAGDAAPAVAGLGGAMGDAAEEADKLTDAQERLVDAFKGFFDPLGVYNGLVETMATKTAEGTEDARDSWEDYADKVDVSLDEVAKQLEADLQAQADWEANLVKVAQSAGADVAGILADMGEEGVRLTAEMADGSKAEVDRMAGLLRAGAAAGRRGRCGRARREARGHGCHRAGRREEDRRADRAAAADRRRQRRRDRQAVRRQPHARHRPHPAGARPARHLAGTSGRARNDTTPIRKAVGGPVWGAGTATSDSIPALLSNGEYVIRADSVGRYGHDFLDAVNEGRYALGGMVRRLAAGGPALPKPPSTAPYGPPISTAGDRTMAHAYGEASEFVKANSAPDLGGDAPGVARMMAALRQAFPGLALISGLRPGAITATGNPSYHGKGRAVDVPPSMAVFEWLRRSYPNSRELIFSPAGGRQIHNGRPHVYSGITKAMHYDHVHWAMRNGGLVGGRPARRAAGGPLGRATMPRPAPRTLTAATRGMTDPASIRAAADAWEAQNDALLRNRELLADLVAAQKELATARSGSAKDLAQAKRELDTDLKLAKTKADRADAYKKYDAVVKDGAEARADAYRSIAEAQQAIRDQQAEDRLDRERAAVDRLVESLERQAEVREEAKSRLDDLLDEERDIRARGVEAEQQYAERVAAIQARSAQAAEELRRQQQRLLDDRRDQLDGWARLDERAAMQWGNSVEQLLDNARSQAAQFEQWSAALAAARAAASPSRSSPRSGSTRARRRSASCASSARRPPRRSTR